MSTTTTRPAPYIAALAVAELFVDHSYQWPLDLPRARRLAESWEPPLIGVIEVQHRYAAAKLRDPKAVLVANIHTGLRNERPVRLAPPGAARSPATKHDTHRIQRQLRPRRRSRPVRHRDPESHRSAPTPADSGSGRVMRPSFPRWIHQQARSTWQRASNATRLKIDLLLLGVILAELLLTVLTAAIALAYCYRLYLRSLKNVSREDDSHIHAYIGDSLSDEALRWAVTSWLRRYRP